MLERAAFDPGRRAIGGWCGWEWYPAVAADAYQASVGFKFLHCGGAGGDEEVPVVAGYVDHCGRAAGAVLQFGERGGAEHGWKFDDVEEFTDPAADAVGLVGPPLLRHGGVSWAHPGCEAITVRADGHDGPFACLVVGHGLQHGLVVDTVRAALAWDLRPTIRRGAGADPSIWRTVGVGAAGGF